ncbi:MAG: hypothetical protein ACK5LR_00020, partial [Mangrovibacterium sp.]
IEQFFVMGRSMNDSYGDIQAAFVRDMQKYHPNVNRTAIVEKDEILEEAFLANIKHGKAEGFYYEDIDDEIVSKILLSFHKYLLGPSSDAFPELEAKKTVHSEVFKYHFRGICTPKGIAELENQMKKNAPNCEFMK